MLYKPIPSEMPVGPMGGSGEKAVDHRCAAIITAVHDEHTVNLGVFGADGKVRSKLNVPMVHLKDTDRPLDGYCEWPKDRPARRE